MLSWSSVLSPFVILTMLEFFIMTASRYLRWEDKIVAIIWWSSWYTSHNSYCKWKREMCDMALCVRANRSSINVLSELEDNVPLMRKSNNWFCKLSCNVLLLLKIGFLLKLLLLLCVDVLVLMLLVLMFRDDNSAAESSVPGVIDYVSTFTLSVLFIECELWWRTSR